MIDLSNPTERTKLAFTIKQDVEKACQEHFKDEPRKHLGASIIGHDCAAYSWNTFRWLKQENFEGRMLRLFNRGHLEEARFIKWLQLIGFTVWETDPKTNAQFKISGCNGHFGGSLDSVVCPPSRYNIADNFLIWLGEFKTHNEKSFNELKKDGVRKSKPKHYKQMCSYGKLYAFKYGLYCAVNKNTDELHFEIVELDYNLADDLFRKAEDIIYSQAQPRKISQVPTYFECKYCHFSGICHKGETPQKNCRSCQHGLPTESASWTCGLTNAKLSDNTIKIGCDSWRRII